MSTIQRSLGQRPISSRSFWLRLALGVACAGSGLPAPAEASPVLFAGSGEEKVHNTQVVVVQKEGGTAVTLLPDYEGSLQSFAVIFAVPQDVQAEDVIVIKREFVDRVDMVSAPRFAEFWEMDPCAPGEAEQVWEIDRKANADTGFLGVVKTDPSKKVAKELLLDVEAEQKKGEYADTFVGSQEQLAAWLKGKDYSLPAGADDVIGKYESDGYKFVAMDVDTSRVELIGGDRAVLSPIRFFTETQLDTIPVRFGMPSAAKDHDLYVYTLHPEKRMEVKNYPTIPAPTNLTVDFAVKERMGEFYNALYDRIATKHPKAFLTEYALTTAECGKPCPTEALLPHELMSLGGDALDASLSEEELNPEPPEPTDEEKAKLEAKKVGKTPAEQKAAEEEWEESRTELARRKALIQRHTYVLTRLHKRYTKDGLSEDPKLATAPAIEGGVDLPKGPEGAASTEVKPASENHFVVRYNNLHPNKVVVDCDNPKPHRWGKPPRSYRGSSKIWFADDMSRKSRTQIKPDEVVLTQVADLGLKGGSIHPPEAAAPPEPVETEAKKEGDCGCRAAGAPGNSWWAALGGLLAGGGLWRRRRFAQAGR